MSDEIDIKAKNLFRDREVHFIVTKLFNLPRRYNFKFVHT